MIFECQLSYKATLLNTKMSALGLLESCPPMIWLWCQADDWSEELLAPQLPPLKCWTTYEIWIASIPSSNRPGSYITYFSNENSCCQFWSKWLHLELTRYRTRWSTLSAHWIPCWFTLCTDPEGYEQRKQFSRVSSSEASLSLTQRSCLSNLSALSTEASSKNIFQSCSKKWLYLFEGSEVEYNRAHQFPLAYPLTGWIHWAALWNSSPKP